MILAIETSTPVCSVALQKDDGRVIEKRIEGAGVHSEKTFLFIRELLQSAGKQVDDLEAVLFSNGPGSYTGLRIGAAAIKGLLFAREIPLYTFPTLLSFAAGVLPADETGTIYAVIDARREHLYRQAVATSLKNIGQPDITELEQLKQQITEGDILIGTGWERMNLDADMRIKRIGSEGISATSLLKAFGNDRLKPYFKNVLPKLFEPEYLTLSQVNNSSIRG